MKYFGRRQRLATAIEEEGSGRTKGTGEAEAISLPASAK
ncbi:MAG: hypothetical protein ACJASX_002652 [Limisphaerales bacterium]|jgi:hypothetical protein